LSKPALNIGDLSTEERLRLIEDYDGLNETPGTGPLIKRSAKNSIGDLTISNAWELVLQQIRSLSK